jgi:hypothetical protein
VETIEGQRDTFLREQRAPEVMQSEFVVDIHSCELETNHGEKVLREDLSVQKGDEH